MSEYEDLSELETITGASEGKWFSPPSPRTGRPLKASWLIYGTDSAEVRKHAVDGVRIKGVQDDDPEALRMKRYDFTAHLVGDWKNTEWEKQPIPFSHSEVVKLFMKCPWLADWVNEIATDRANFLPPVSQA